MKIVLKYSKELERMSKLSQQLNLNPRLCTFENIQDNFTLVKRIVKINTRANIDKYFI